MHARVDAPDALAINGISCPRILSLTLPHNGLIRLLLTPIEEVFGLIEMVFYG